MNKSGILVLFISVMKNCGLDRDFCRVLNNCIYMDFVL